MNDNDAEQRNQEEFKRQCEEQDRRNQEVTDELISEFWSTFSVDQIEGWQLLERSPETYGGKW
jgi:hypothetical protein